MTPTAASRRVAASVTKCVLSRRQATSGDSLQNSQEIIGPHITSILGLLVLPKLTFARQIGELFYARFEIMVQWQLHQLLPLFNGEQSDERLRCSIERGLSDKIHSSRLFQGIDVVKSVHLAREFSECVYGDSPLNCLPPTHHGMLIHAGYSRVFTELSEMMFDE